MDKYEYKLKTEQMLKLMEDNSYSEAAEIADVIDWKRVRNIGILTSVAEIYERNKEYQKSYDVLKIAYHRAQSSRKIIYRLCILALKTKNVDEAIDYYDEFVKAAPKDPNRDILQYQILRARHAPIEQQIKILERFKRSEYIEKWAYELAKLYQEAGMTAECLEECDDLILWFSDGKYVYQAMELKMQYKPLTPSQQYKYDRRNNKADGVTEEIPNVTEYKNREEQDKAENEALPEFLRKKKIGNTMKLDEALKSLLQPEGMQETTGEEVHREETEDEKKFKEIENGIAEMGSAIDETEPAVDLELLERLSKEKRQAKRKEKVDPDLEELVPSPLEEDAGMQAKKEAGAEPAEERTAEGSAELPELEGASLKEDDQIEGQMSFDDILAGWIQQPEKEEQPEEKLPEQESGAEEPEENAAEMNESEGAEEEPEESRQDTGSDEAEETEEEEKQPEQIEEGADGLEEAEKADFEEIGEPDKTEKDGEEKPAEGKEDEETEADPDNEEEPEEQTPLEGFGELETVGVEELEELEKIDGVEADKIEELEESVAEELEESEAEEIEEAEELEKSEAEEIEETEELEKSEAEEIEETEELEESEAEEIEETEELEESEVEGLEKVEELEESDVEELEEEEAEEFEEAEELEESEAEESEAEEIEETEELEESETEEFEEEEELEESEAEEFEETEELEESEAEEFEEEEELEESEAEELKRSEAEELDEADEYEELEEEPEQDTDETAAGLDGTEADMFLSPEIQRLIDEIEGVIPEEEPEENKPKVSFGMRARSKEENMGAITDQLRIEDVLTEIDDYDGNEEEDEGSTTEETGADQEEILDPDDSEDYIEGSDENGSAEEDRFQWEEDEYEDDIRSVKASLEEEFRPQKDYEEDADDREIPDEDDDKINFLSESVPLSRKQTAKLIATGKTSPLPMGEISDAMSMTDTGFIVHGRYDLKASSGIGTRAGLTEEQKKLFSYFVPVRGMSEQLVDILERDKHCTDRKGTSCTGNLLIIGNKGNGKTVLAVDVVKAIQKQRNIRQGKVAIVTGEALNKKKISDIFKKLYGGALIIEKAGRLDEKTVGRLNRAMEQDTGELFVVLEDQRKPLDRLLTSSREFRRKFTSRLEVPVFVNDELVTFGQTYAQENGYRIDEMGILALYSRIDLLQREDHAVTVAEVKEIMDGAITHSQKASAKKLMRKMFGRNTDEEDRIILSERDFNV